MGDQLGNHRIIIRGNDIATAHRAVTARQRRQAQMAQTPRRGQKVISRILGIQPRFDRVTVYAQRVLRQWQGRAKGYMQLPCHQINAGDRLGDRMLDLQSGVHLHKPEPVRAQPVRGINDKFDRSCALIANHLSCGDRCVTHCRPHLKGHTRRGRLFDDFLMTPLQRAVTFKKMHSMGAVTKDLYFNMARCGDVFFDQHRTIAKP